MDTPFAVVYRIDEANRNTFAVQQNQNIGKVFGQHSNEE